jgi:hypothetical protein
MDPNTKAENFSTIVGGPLATENPSTTGIFDLPLYAPTPTLIQSRTLVPASTVNVIDGGGG